NGRSGNTKTDIAREGPARYNSAVPDPGNKSAHVPIPLSGCFGQTPRRPREVANAGNVEVSTPDAIARKDSGARPFLEFHHASSHDAPDARSWRAFRPPDPLLEPAHGAVHLRCARQDPHHRPRKDPAAVQRCDELRLGPGAEARH